MKAPLYCIVGARPVKVLSTPDGGLGVYAFSWETGDFEINMHYLGRIYFDTQDDFEELSEKKFEDYVLNLRKERGFFDEPT